MLLPCVDGLYAALLDLAASCPCISVARAEEFSLKKATLKRKIR
jgi:hypothetical protein